MSAMSRIKIVSHWSDSEHQAFVQNATRIKAIWLRHGAEDFRVDRLHLGQAPGQYRVTTTFASWEAFGRASERITGDQDFVEMMSASYSNGRMTARELLVEVELD
jgi:hypothetical protein